MVKGHLLWRVHQKNSDGQYTPLEPHVVNMF